jgi:hypothetical protein
MRKACYGKITGSSMDNDKVPNIAGKNKKIILQW